MGPSATLPTVLIATLLCSGIFCYEDSKGNVFASDPVIDHLFVFEGEASSIDCLEKNAGEKGKGSESVLVYRQTADSEPVNIMFGLQDRPDAPEELKSKKGEGEHDFVYTYDNTPSKAGGEYECDWTKEQDEVNHYLVVLKKDTIKCPVLKNPIYRNIPLEDVTCSISKTGFVREGWLNSTSGLQFIITDPLTQKPMDVVYAEEADSLSATLKDVSLVKEHNGTKLTCMVTSKAGNIAECQTNEADVDWPPAGVQVVAEEYVIAGEEAMLGCSATDLGNPDKQLILKISGVEVKSEAVLSFEHSLTAKKEDGPVINVVCSGGGIVQDEKNITVAYGPSEVVAKEAIITLWAGLSLSLSCDAADSNPEAVVSYELDGKKMDSNINVTAIAAHNGKVVKCIAVNPLTKTEVKADIKLEIKYPPEVKKGEEERSVKLGSMTKLDCSTDAYPEPTYEWKFPTGNTSSSVATIVIDQVSEVNLGTYACTITNELGSAEKVFTLNENKVEPIDTTGRKGNGSASTISSSLSLLLIVFSLLLLRH